VAAAVLPVRDREKEQVQKQEAGLIKAGFALLLIATPDQDDVQSLKSSHGSPDDKRQNQVRGKSYHPTRLTVQSAFLCLVEFLHQPLKPGRPLQYYEDQDQAHNRDGDDRINDGQHDEADERLRLKRHEASKPLLGECQCLVAKGKKSVISSMANRSMRLRIRVLGNPDTCVDRVLAFSPYSIIWKRLATLPRKMSEVKPKTLLTL